MVKLMVKLAILWLPVEMGAYCTTHAARGGLLAWLALSTLPLSAVAFAPRFLHLPVSQSASLSASKPVSQPASKPVRRSHHHLAALAAVNRVPDLPVIGNAASLLWHGDLAQLLCHEAARGPVSRIRFGQQEVFLLSDPALVNSKP